MLKYLITVFMLLSLEVFSQIKHGPIVGAVTDSSAIFVVQTYSQQKVRIEINDVKSTGKTQELIAYDSNYNYVKIPALGLSPNTRYIYRAIVDSQTSSQWKTFQTFPKEDNFNFSFGFGSCQQSGYSKWNPEIFPIVGNDTLRFFIQIGDWTYPDTTEKKYGYRFNSKWDLLEKSYASKYDNNYPFVSEVLLKMPVMYVYDDHDYAANNPDGTDSNKHKSIEAYQKFFPHYKLENPKNGIWQKFSFSNVDFFMLDLRAQRSSAKNAFDKDGNYKPKKDHSILAGFTINGVNQKEWFLEELRKSKAKFKVIVSSVLFNPAYSKALGNKVLSEKYPWMKDDVADKWAGFPNEQKEIINFIKENKIENVIIISGDSHSSYIDDGANSVFPEISASMLDVNNTLVHQKLLEGGVNIWNKGSVEDEGHNYGRISFNFKDNPYALMEIVDHKGIVKVSYKYEAK